MVSNWRIINAEVVEGLKSLDADSIQTVITSPPYWGLRDYGIESQLGLEPTPEAYVDRLVGIFREIRRVLRDDGTVWLNMGDSYAGSGKGGNPEDSPWAGFVGNKDRELSAQTHQSAGKAPPGLKPKDLCMIPARVALALQADGWWIRMDIIWSKPNPMPESVTDRTTKAHEYIFLLTKSERYFYDADAIAEESIKTGVQHSYHRADNPKYDGAPAERWKHQFDGRDWGEAGTRNKRSVWTVATEPYPEAHFAVYPTKLIEPCVLAGTSEKGQCIECHTPYRRVTKIDRSYESGSGRSGNIPKGKNPEGVQVGGDRPDVRMGPVLTVETIGWEQGCECSADVEPQTVLDPFCGSGTTGVVALRHGRNFVGIELNEEYVRMAEYRIDNDCPLFNRQYEVD